MNKTNVENFFATVNNTDVTRYTNYWESIKPVSYDDFFRRYLFAFTSVHTTWESNVRGYNAIKDLGWVDSKADLLNRLIDARCGMHNNRTEYIWNFRTQFYSNPEKYCAVGTDWQSYRNELVNEINGLGIAKVSFALEMCFPNEAQITCIDTHIIQFYELLHNKGFKSKKEVEIYQTAENHWLDCSKAIKAAPSISRSIYWDKKQNKTDCRYWSYVLED